MSEPTPPAQPPIELVELPNGEVTLYIAGGQAMQGWERELMRESADILCTYGGEFLEVGLGLGISALRIAGHAFTRTHTVVEKYARVIELFRERHPDPPQSLQIVEADFFDYIRQQPPGRLDGIFFDPYFVDVTLWRDAALWDEVTPFIVRALRTGGVFMPCFSTVPELRRQFVPFFRRVIVERRTFETYAGTDYTFAASGAAYIQCFVKTEG